MKRKCAECYYAGIVRGTKEYKFSLNGEMFIVSNPENICVCSLDNELISDRETVCKAFTVNPYYIEKFHGWTLG